MRQRDSGCRRRDRLRAILAETVLRKNRRLQTAMRSSRLPAVKTIEAFDFALQTSIKREQIKSLREIELSIDPRT